MRGIDIDRTALTSPHRSWVAAGIGTLPKPATAACAAAEIPGSAVGGHTSTRPRVVNWLPVASMCCEGPHPATLWSGRPVVAGACGVRRFARAPGAAGAASCRRWPDPHRAGTAAWR